MDMQTAYAGYGARKVWHKEDRMRLSLPLYSLGEEIFSAVSHGVGALFGAAGAVSLCATNGTTPTINFSTIASMFACFLPLFFSGFIVKFCNKQLAILLGCIGYEFIQIGFGQLSFTIAAFTSDVYKVIEAGILVLFLIYLNNEGIITDILTMRRYRQHIPKKETST